MDPRDQVATAWQEAGTDQVMLPTGTEARVMLPGPGAMARLELTPGALRGIVGRLTGKLEHGGMSADDWQRWRGAIRELIAEAVTAVRIPGGEDFAPHRVDPDDRIPPIDEDALTTLVLRLESPAQVDARSRVAHGGQPAAVAGATWARAAHSTLPAWEPFIGSDEGLRCALSARTWGTRPSILLGITEPVVAYAVDEALALRLLLQQRTSRSKDPLPPEFYEDTGRVPYDADVAADVARAHLEQLAAEGRVRTH